MSNEGDRDFWKNIIIASLIVNAIAFEFGYFTFESSVVFLLTIIAIGVVKNV